MLARLDDHRDLVPVDTLDAAARDRVDAMKSKARSDRTRKAYDTDFAAFRAWCDGAGHWPLPAAPSTVAAYIVHLATDDGRKVATIVRRLASISVAHKLAGFKSPTSDEEVAETMGGIRRTVGVAQRKKAPLVTEHLQRVLEPLGGSDVDLRDRAILVLGFAAALRRSEIVALDVEDLAFVPEGLIVTIRRSKTDQDGAGADIHLPYGSQMETCPVRVVETYLAAVGAKSGPAFLATSRTGRILRRRLHESIVGKIVKRRAAAVGIDGDLGGHSLRAGCATVAANNGVPLAISMQHTRHKSVSVALGYVRQAEAWKHNAAAKLGL